MSDTTLTASSSVATGTVQHRRNVSATAVLTAAREELCRHDDEQVKATGVPLAWLVDSSKAKAALRQYTRDSGALARAAQRDDEGLLQLEPLQPGEQALPAALQTIRLLPSAPVISSQCDLYAPHRASISQMLFLLPYTIRLVGSRHARIVHATYHASTRV